MYGIENLKKLIKFGCDFTKQIATSGVDGWQWTDGISFIDDAIAIPGVAKSFPAIKQELSELSEEERTELNEYVENEFDIPNDEVEVFVEHSLMLAISFIALVGLWKTLKEG